MFESRRDDCQRGFPHGNCHGSVELKHNYIVELHFKREYTYTSSKEIDVIIKQFNSYRFDRVKDDQVRLYFKHWKDALDMIITFWSKRLEGVHVFSNSVIKPGVFICSEKDEMMDTMKGLFVKYIKGKLLLNCEVVRKLRKERESISDDIAEIQALKHRRHVSFCEKKIVALVAKRELIKFRLSPFREAMDCILRYLHVEGIEYSSGQVDIYRLDRDFDWSRIHHVLMRECRRLEENLPIYLSRRKILQEVHLQQVIVLIGETGSGKSTQLVQYLADSGVVGDGSIVCTQPRKIAAVSLAHRVEEESMGCYDNNSIGYCQFYSSAQKLKSKPHGCI